MSGLIVVLIFSVIVGFVLYGCTSTNQDTPISLDPPKVKRQDLQFGFYGSASGQLKETANIVSYHMVTNWDGELNADLIEAKKLGIPVILSFPDTFSVSSIAEHLTTLDVLDNVFAVYPWDEPDRRNDVTLQVMENVIYEIHTYLPKVKVAVIYSNAHNTPGIHLFDLVGFDNYVNREFIFTNGEYKTFRDKVIEEQKIILVPGGADPWRQDPETFINIAHNDSKVWGIMAFLYRDLDSGAGIKSNGLLGRYSTVLSNR